jgi:hypothetical protein
MDRSPAESFLPYLQYKQQLERAKQPAPVAGGTPFSLLAVLGNGHLRAMPLTELQAAGGMSFDDFAEAVKRLQSSGYLTISGDPGKEIAELTALGADVVQLVRPK